MSSEPWSLEAAILSGPNWRVPLNIRGNLSVDQHLRRLRADARQEARVFAANGRIEQSPDFPSAVMVLSSHASLDRYSISIALGFVLLAGRCAQTTSVKCALGLRAK